MKDLKHLIWFEDLLQQANNELVQRAAAEGQLALGYNCYYIPEVLLNLPGCFSSRLRAPNSGTAEIASYYMTNRNCPYVRCILERAIEGGFNYLNALFGAEGCAAAEYTDGESVLFKELLLSPDKMGRGLAALERVLPGARCYVRTPALWDGMKGSYLQPFGMIKWYSAEKRALWGEGTHGYMGLGFD